MELIVGISFFAGAMTGAGLLAAGLCLGYKILYHAREELPLGEKTPKPLDQEFTDEEIPE